MPTPLVYMGELAVSSALLERRVHLFNQREQETGVRRSEQRLTRSGPQGNSHLNSASHAQDHRANPTSPRVTH